MLAASTLRFLLLVPILAASLARWRPCPRLSGGSRSLAGTVRGCCAGRWHPPRNVRMLNPRTHSQACSAFAGCGHQNDSFAQRLALNLELMSPFLSLAWLGVPPDGAFVAQEGWHGTKWGKPSALVTLSRFLGLARSPLGVLGQESLGCFPGLAPTPRPPRKGLVFLKYLGDLLCAFKCGSVNGAVTLFRVNSSLPSQPTQTGCLIGQCSLNKLLVSTEQMIVNCLPQIILFLLC